MSYAAAVSLAESIRDLEDELDTKNNQIEEWEAYEQEQIEASKEFEKLMSKCEKLEQENKELKDEIECRKSHTDTEIGELKEEINHKNNKFSDWIEENKELKEALDEMNSFSMFKKWRESEAENKKLKKQIEDS